MGTADREHVIVVKKGRHKLSLAEVLGGKREI